MTSSWAPRRTHWLHLKQGKLRDLIAATSLIILPKLDSNHRFFGSYAHINSLGPSDTIWRQRYGSTLAQVMACCLTAPSHYLNQCWLIISNSDKISDFFLYPVTLKFDGWPWKTIGHLFYTTLSFVHHFKATSEFKPELQSGNAQFGSKSVIFLSPVTLKFDGWHWKTIWHLFYAASSFEHHFIAIGEFKLELQYTEFGSKSIFLAM